MTTNKEIMDDYLIRQYIQDIENQMQNVEQCEVQLSSVSKHLEQKIFDHVVNTLNYAIGFPSYKREDTGFYYHWSLLISKS